MILKKDSFHNHWILRLISRCYIMTRNKCNMLSRPEKNLAKINRSSNYTTKIYDVYLKKKRKKFLKATINSINSLPLPTFSPVCSFWNEFFLKFSTILVSLALNARIFPTGIKLCRWQFANFWNTIAQPSYLPYVRFIFTTASTSSTELLRL